MKQKKENIRYNSRRRIFKRNQILDMLDLLPGSHFSLKNNFIWKDLDDFLDFLNLSWYSTRVWPYLIILLQDRSYLYANQISKDRLKSIFKLKNVKYFSIKSDLIKAGLITETHFNHNILSACISKLIILLQKKMISNDEYITIKTILEERIDLLIRELRIRGKYIEFQLLYLVMIMYNPQWTKSILSKKLKDLGLDEKTLYQIFFRSERHVNMEHLVENVSIISK